MRYPTGERIKVGDIFSTTRNIYDIETYHYPIGGYKIEKEIFIYVVSSLNNKKKILEVYRYENKKIKETMRHNSNMKYITKDEANKILILKELNK